MTTTATTNDNIITISGIIEKQLDDAGSFKLKMSIHSKAGQYIKYVKLVDYDDHLEYIQPFDEIVCQVVLISSSQQQERQQQRSYQLHHQMMERYQIVRILQFHRPLHLPQLLKFIENNKMIGTPAILTNLMQQLTSTPSLLNQISENLILSKWEKVKELIERNPDLVAPPSSSGRKKSGSNNDGAILRQLAHQILRLGKDRIHFNYLIVIQYLESFPAFRSEETMSSDGGNDNSNSNDNSKMIKQLSRIIYSILTKSSEASSAGTTMMTPDELINIISTNVYLLIIDNNINYHHDDSNGNSSGGGGSDSSSISLFKIIDRVARLFPDNDYGLSRVHAGLICCLHENKEDCYSTEAEIAAIYTKQIGPIDNVENLFKGNPGIVRYSLSSSASTTESGSGSGNNKKIVFLKRIDHQEKFIAQFIKQHRSIDTVAADDVDDDTIIDNTTLDETQHRVVKAIQRLKFAIVTGPPGVGKTRVISAIYHQMKKRKRGRSTVILSAPTGLACKNLANFIRDEACQIYTVAKLNHEIILMESSTTATAATVTAATVTADDGDKVEADVSSSSSSTAVATSNRPPTFLATIIDSIDGIIIDEASMLDLSDFYHLVKAIKPHCQIILVGDPNQLPSIGPGQVLLDLIKSQRVPVFELKKNYRQLLYRGNNNGNQAKSSTTIISNAFKIINGNYLSPLEQSSDFKIGRTNSDEDTLRLSLEIIERLRRSTSTMEELLDHLIILSPYSKNNKQFLSTHQINKTYQGKLNENVDNLTSSIMTTTGQKSSNGSKFPFSIGDRVMQSVNDPNKGVVNGDIGYIRIIKTNAYDKVDEVTVEYPGSRYVKYLAKVAKKELSLAYAISVHKSQGNGCKYVIILIPQQYHASFFNRNMLYTAVTRAKERLYLIGGDYRPSIKQITNERKTKLAHRLSKSIPAVAADAVATSAVAHTIDSTVVEPTI